MANTKPLCCGRKHAKNCQRTIKLQRLKSLQGRLERNELSRMYQKAMTHVTQGCARKMKEEEIPGKSSKTWYLPHKPVFHPQKADKIKAAVDVAF